MQAGATRPGRIGLWPGESRCRVSAYEPPPVLGEKAWR
jgi:hypothetical protein